jgi:hypothetical protein
MELTTKQVHEAIDKILPSFANESSVKNLKLMGIRQIRLIDSKIDNHVDRVFRIMKDNNLIHSRTMDSYALTEFGKEVLENGGWLKHRAAIEYEKQLERETKELNLKQLKVSIFQMKNWFLILLITAIVGGLFGAFFQYIIDQIEKN